MDPGSAAAGEGDIDFESLNWLPGRLARLLDQSPCTCTRHSHDSDHSGPPNASFPPTPTCRTCHGSTHLKVLSSLRSTVSFKAAGSEMQAPTTSFVEQKSPAPPKCPSCNSKRPSRKFCIFCPEPALF
eukprot:GGOE01013403.1.p2 GENE.GGOE01013403.1~~GGOE01013403.1.p2  ORF type:complete len:128 (+),score=25.76 GGOE01013403.1:2-385(+)